MPKLYKIGGRYFVTDQVIPAIELSRAISLVLYMGDTSLDPKPALEKHGDIDPDGIELVAGNEGPNNVVIVGEFRTSADDEYCLECLREAEGRSK